MTKIILTGTLLFDITRNYNTKKLYCHSPAKPSQAKPDQPSQPSQAKKPRLGDTIIAKNNNK